RCAVGEFHHHRAGLRQWNDCLTGRVNIRKVQKSGRLMRIIRNGPQHCLSDKRQCAFGTDQQMRHNVERMLEVYEGIKRIPDRSLHLVLLPDSVVKLAVSKYSFSYSGKC